MTCPSFGNGLRQPVDYKPNPRFKKTCFKMEDLSFCNMQCECNVHANADRLERESGLQWSRRGVTVARVPCALGCHGLSNAVTRIPEKSGTNCEAATEGENHLWNSGGTTRIQANCIAYMGHIASRIKHLLLFMLHWLDLSLSLFFFIRPKSDHCLALSVSIKSLKVSFCSCWLAEFHKFCN